MQSKFVALETGRVHYLSNGRTDRPALILLHGKASSAASFEELASALEDNFHLIALDFPGHGQSDFLSMPRDAHGYSMEGLRVLLDKIIRHLDLPEYSIAANSLGAMIAVQTLPSLHGLKSLILMSSVHACGKDDFFSNIRSDSPSKMSLKPVYDDTDIEVLIDAFIHSSRVGKPRARMVHDLRNSDGNFRGQLVHFMESQAWPDETELLAQSTVPLLYIGGRDDPFIQPSYYGKLASSVPRISDRIVLLDNVCHAPHLEDPAACSRLIADFVTRHAGKPQNDSAEERLFRAPYLQPRPGDGRPLTVLCSLISRADSTPLTERRRADGHVLDHAGQVIADPAADATANGFEGNANLHFEHWGEYCRKVHGPRFTYAEEPDDRSLDRLLRYDHLYRFAPGPTHTDAPPYRMPVDARGKLWPTIIGHIEPYRRPRWDCIAYMNFANTEDMDVMLLDNPRIREKILPEDWAIFRDITPVLSRQYIIVPSDTGNEALTLVKVHVRATPISREDFQHRWLHDHAALVATHAKRWVKRYVQLHNIGPTEPGQRLYHPLASGIDGVTLMGFASLNDIEDFLRSPEQKIIAEDEGRIASPDAGEWWTAVGAVLVNRVAPEHVTDVPPHA